MISDHRLAALQERLRDRRSRRVVFLSHCLLNENTRYLGGANHRGAIESVVRACLDANLGMVQMPCPEQCAWGGVLKRRLLLAYGLRERAPWAYVLRRPLLAFGLLYTRWRYARLADAVVAQAADYVSSGFEVAGIVGVDGSPSCGVGCSVDPWRVDLLLALPLAELSVDRQDAILRHANRPGPGLFVRALRRALAKRRVRVPLLAYDLFAELEGRPTALPLEAGANG
jgi:hypothetical protein